MAYNDSKSIEAVFSCGHTCNIRFVGNMTQALAQAEKRLCPECRKKQLKRLNVKEWVPYWYYKEHLKHSRDVVAGVYDKTSGKIEVWLPPKKFKEYADIVNRIYFELHNSPIMNNGCTITIYVKGKRTADIKDSLKALGFKWNRSKLMWQLSIDVEVEFDENHNVLIKTQSYYKLKRSLEALGCIANYKYLNW